VVIQFDLDAELATAVALLTCYQSVTVSPVDAELVRMAELYSNSFVFTLDSDFQLYRKNRNCSIPLLSPQ